MLFKLALEAFQDGRTDVVEWLYKKAAQDAGDINAYAYDAYQFLASGFDVENFILYSLFSELSMSISSTASDIAELFI